MSIRKTIIAALLVAASCAAQTTPTDRTFEFKNKPSARRQALQEIASVLRTVGGIEHFSLDSDATVTVTGNADELNTAAWIIHELDRPAQIVASPGDQFPVPPAMEDTAHPGDDTIRVFFLQHAETSAWETSVILLLVADIHRISYYDAPHAIVVRGTAAEIALARRLIDAIDVKPGSLTASADFSHSTRVFYLTNPATPQEILRVLRTVVDIQNVFSATAAKAIAIRGSASELALCEWIIRSLDIPASGKPEPDVRPREFTMPASSGPNNVVRVFYPAPQDIQQVQTLLRSQLPAQHVFTYTSLPAIVARGTSDQVAKAEHLIQR